MKHVNWAHLLACNSDKILPSWQHSAGNQMSIMSKYNALQVMWGAHIVFLFGYCNRDYSYGPLTKRGSWVNHDTTHKDYHYGNSSIARCQLGEHFGQSHLARYMHIPDYRNSKAVSATAVPPTQSTPESHHTQLILVKGGSHWLQVVLHQVHHTWYMPIVINI